MCFISDPAEHETDLALIKKAIVFVFNIQLSESESIPVQDRSEELGGLWVDIREEERIPVFKVPLAR